MTNADLHQELPGLPPGALVLAYLEHYPEPGGTPHRIPLEHLPFRIGRGTGVQHIVSSRLVSKEHAEISRRDDALRIRDLGSTNGTYVNGERISEAVLAHGDIVHVADKEFLFVQQDLAWSLHDRGTDPAGSGQAGGMPQACKLLRDLIAQQRVRILFQPIVRLDSRAPIGYEALGRGNQPGLDASPASLFRLAEQARLAVELSQVFRRRALEEGLGLPGRPVLFCNVHPAELASGSLLPSLLALPAPWQEPRRVVLEVHENVVADSAALGRLRADVRALGFGIAFDDLGAGQSRLVELCEVPPDYVKLDRQLVHGIEHLGPRQEIVQGLVRASRALGFQIIAEGIETPAQAEMCRRLGCQLGQGFLFSLPQSVSQIVARSSEW
jgi:EAL domain-containing protein (putative c-di-GMP-specific phosphodiesterase class I)